MDIYLLDENFELVETIDQFESLIWHRKYYTCGNFELQTSDQYFQSFVKTHFVYIRGKKETGIVQSYKQDNKDGKAYLKGRFMEIELSRIVIPQTLDVNGYCSDICNRLVERIPDTFVRLPQLTPLTTKIIRKQFTGTDIMTACYELAKTEERSIRVAYTFATNSAFFSLWQGLDRTDGQTSNSSAVFSDNFENIITSSYLKDESEFKNVAIVAGEGEGTDRVIVEVDQSNGSTRYELYVDARDLQKGDLTDAQYKEVLTQRGLDKLLEYNVVETIVFAINPNSNLIYQRDFDLGDKCTYVDQSSGIQMDDRITEVMESYEKNQIILEITFGEGEKTLKSKVKRGL